MTLAATHAALLTALQNTPNLRVTDNPNPGTPPGDALGILDLDTIAFDQTMGRGSDLFTFDLLLLVATSSPRTQLATIEKLLHDVKATAEAADLIIQVMQAAGFSTYSVNQVEMYGCHLTIVVTAVA